MFGNINEEIEIVSDNFQQDINNSNSIMMILKNHTR